MTWKFPFILMATLFQADGWSLDFSLSLVRTSNANASASMFIREMQMQVNEDVYMQAQ